MNYLVFLCFVRAQRYEKEKKIEGRPKLSYLSGVNQSWQIIFYLMSLSGINKGFNPAPYVRSLAVLLLFFLTFQSFGQFYNGSQLTFGKNRVQFNNFFWTFYRFEKFDTYYYLNGKTLAQYAAEYADKHIKEVELELQSNIEEKIQFIIFNSLTDLKQSNIGLSGNWDSYNTGGVTRIIGGEVLIYFDGNYDHFERQIRAGIAQVILNEMIYGTGIGSQIKNNAIFGLPEWYTNGLISYISEKWDPETDNLVRDAIVNGRYNKFSKLTGMEAANAGHSLWNYIAIKYGEAVIPNIVYMARLSRNVEKGFQYTIGVSYNDLIKEWLEYYKGIYTEEVNSRAFPSGEMLVNKPRQERVYRQLKISPDGTHIAYCTHELGVHKVFLVDTEKKKTRKIYRGGYRLSERPDYSYPLLAWHPSGDVLAMITEKKGEPNLYIYSLEDKHFEKQILYNFQKILDFSYSDDGNFLVFSAIQRGQSDIFVFNIASGSYEQITRDQYNDLNPRFINHSKEIIFSSNRPTDTLRFDPKTDISKLHFTNDIFIYDYAGKKNILKRITNTPLTDEIQPMAYADNYLTYLSDQNGIYNRVVAKSDSAITYIDTTTHYRYFTSSFPATNYSRNILEQDISVTGGKTAEIVFLNNRYSLFTNDLVKPKHITPVQLYPTSFGRQLQGKAGQGGPRGKKDNAETTQQESKPISKKHFSTVRLSEVGKENRVKDSITAVQQNKRPPALSSTGADTLKGKIAGTFLKPLVKDTINKYKNAKQLNYNVEYAIDQLVTQFDFNYLNSAYQPFTGAHEPIFINSGFNALLLVGVTDLMEDYRITGGLRLNFNLVNNEYLLSYSNLHRRLDHQIIYHRQTVEEIGDTAYIRHKINEFYYIASWPFNPVLSLKGTASLRYDRAVFLSIDQGGLKRPDNNKYWGNLKGELTYDNTRDIGVNLYYGTRYKVFGEYYQLMNASDQNMIVLGADIRHYEKIHRTMILALRFAASTSFGHNKLIYYMGGVDNWLSPSFNQDTPIAKDQNYAFQTLATNMRGFDQNIRNGNSFAVINSEIRLPVFRYFFNRPIRSDFINNFQVVAFGDIGTAWTGLNPYSIENQLFNHDISSGPLNINVQMMKDPVVEGFGGGLRTRLLGYFIRGDLAWGVEDGRINKPKFYLSLSLDF
ncbi:MAG: hypothetical protein NTX61_01195 [Bacteroidetes bacterium]|nr:hypothetical protein [Bacteroidota bacterium]